MHTNGTGKHTRTDVVHVHVKCILNIPWRWKHTELKHQETDEFLTLLRLLPKKEFMNENKRVATSSF